MKELADISMFESFCGGHAQAPTFVDVFNVYELQGDDFDPNAHTFRPDAAHGYWSSLYDLIHEFVYWATVSSTDPKFTAAVKRVGHGLSSSPYGAAFYDDIEQQIADKYGLDLGGAGLFNMPAESVPPGVNVDEEYERLASEGLKTLVRESNCCSLADQIQSTLDDIAQVYAEEAPNFEADRYSFCHQLGVKGLDAFTEDAVYKGIMPPPVKSFMIAG